MLKLRDFGVFNYPVSDLLGIAEAFSKAQINNNSIGPKDVNALYSIEDLKNDFGELTITELSEYHIDLKEGSYHEGPADVIRLIAIRHNNRVFLILNNIICQTE